MLVSTIAIGFRRQMSRALFALRQIAFFHCFQRLVKPLRTDCRMTVLRSTRMQDSRLTILSCHVTY